MRFVALRGLAEFGGVPRAEVTARCGGQGVEAGMILLVGPADSSTPWFFGSGFFASWTEPPRGSYVYKAIAFLEWFCLALSLLGTGWPKA